MGDARWKEILRTVMRAERAHVRVGVLASKGGEAEQDGITMVEMAAIHEFGSPAANIPARSFIRRTLVWNAGPWLPQFVANLAGRVVEGRLDEKKALGILGQKAVAMVKAAITGAHIPPPLRPATIAAKGSDRPLVDTGRLLGAISYEVVE
jgi:hypothetical protein